MGQQKRFKSASHTSVKAFKVLGGIDSLYYFADTTNDSLYQSFFDNMLNLCDNFSFDDFQANLKKRNIEAPAKKSIKEKRLTFKMK